MIAYLLSVPNILKMLLNVSNMSVFNCAICKRFYVLWNLSLIA